MKTIKRIVSCLLTVLCIATFGLLLAGCSDSKKPAMPASSSPLLTQAAVPAVPQESPEEEAKLSGGLGLSQAAFEIHAGKIAPCNKGSKVFCTDDRSNNHIIISSFSPSAPIRDFMIEFMGSPNLAHMRKISSAYIPKDSIFIETYSLEGPNGPVDSPSDAPIDLYHSQWLATRFPKERWASLGVKPGTFYVKHINAHADIDIGRERR